MPEQIVVQPEVKTGEVSEQKEQEIKAEEIKQETKQEQVPKEDLISRVSKVKVEAKKEETTNPFNLTKDDYDKVQSDPTLSKFYKSMQADYIRKTQNLSEKEKEVEKIKQQSANWTPERIQQLMNDPQFVQAAQQVAATKNPPNSGLTDDEYSALTDKEKAQLSNMQQQLHQMQLQNWQMQQKQQDEQLKGKYANYAPDIVDTTVSKLIRGEVQANREYIWKAMDYEDAVNRAYQLGLQDRATQLNEKQNATSVEGFSATPQSEVPKQEQNESNNNYFKRLAQRRLAEFKGRNQ
jgi:hypothetical protein